MTATPRALEVIPPNFSAGFRPVETGARASPDIESLTKQMLKGDEMAYRTFYDAYFDRLWRYLLVVSAGNEDTAREALQATLLRVVRHVKVFRDEEHFWSWLTVLARTAYLDETRKRRRYFSFLERFTRHSETAIDHLPGHHADKKLQDSLKNGLAVLPADEQKLIEQKYFDRRTVRDIAEELQMTPKAIESKLSRIRRKLKQTMLSQWNHESD